MTAKSFFRFWPRLEALEDRLTPASTPFGGTPWAVPGPIEAENFDSGGEGVAYHDLEAANQGGSYRTSEGVDIQATTDAGGGFNVGWVRGGEWLKYTTNVASAGPYDLSLRLANPATGGSLHVEVDGVNVTGSLAVPNTGGWQNWTTINKTGISLSAGQHVVTIAFDVNASNGAVGNLNWFSFASASPNLAPTVATPAAASPGTVTGTTTNLSVVGADDGGEANLTYTWAATIVPGGASPAFSANGSNAAKNTSITFNRAGNYTFQVTIRDAGGLTATSSVNVAVNQTPTSIVVSPSSVSVANSGTQQFTATARDQFATALTSQPGFTWSVDSGGVGTVNSTGLYTAPISGTGSATVRAGSGSISGTASVTVTTASSFSAKINFQPASAPVPAGYLVDGGAVFADRGNGLSYGWDSDISARTRDRNVAADQRYDTLVHMSPPGGTGPSAVWEIAVPNGTYSVHVVVGDPSYADVISLLTAEGTLILSGSTGGSQLWLETTAPVVVSDGRLTIGNQAGSYNKIDYLDIASASGSNQTPTVATPAAANPNPVGGTTTNLSVLGADDGGEANLTYTWAVSAKPAGASDPTFSVNGSNAAKNTTATFGRTGAYTFQVTIRDAGGLTAMSSVSVTVNATLTSIAVAPASATVSNGQTQQFTASARDQFGQPLSAQPVFSWSVDASGIGTISGSGLYTAPASGTGSATVRATTGSVSGTAAVTVTAPQTVFTSNFDGTETPLSEGGVWNHLDPTLTPAQKKNGVAFGTQVAGSPFGPYDDSQAYVTGFGSDYEVEGVVWVKPGISGPANREVEIILRWTDNNPLRDTPYGPTHSNGYEINWQHAGAYMGLGRFKGAELVHLSNVPAPHTGDRFRARIVGQTITVWINDVQQLQFTDNDPTLKVTTGNPGIGFFTRAANDDFGFDSVKFTKLGLPEMLDGTPLAESNARNLTQRQLDRAVDVAIQLWSANGLSSAQYAALHQAHFVIADLPGGLLGYTAGDVVTIDTNAAGYGWSLGAVASPHKVDLLTVVSHELGHVMGLSELHGNEQEPNNVMDDTLAPGVRRLPSDLHS